MHVVDSPTSIIQYQFTVVKLPKLHYSIGKLRSNPHVSVNPDAATESAEAYPYHDS